MTKEMDYPKLSEIYNREFTKLGTDSGAELTSELRGWVVSKLREFATAAREVK